MNIKMLFAVTVPFVLIVVAILSVIVFQHYVSQNIKSHVLYTLEESSDKQISILNAKLDGQYTVLETFAHSLPSNELFVSDNVVERMNILARSSLFTNVGVATKDGCAYINNGSQIDIFDKWYFKESMSGNRAIEKIEKSDITNKPCLVLSVPIIQKDNSMGAVLGTYNEDGLRSLLSSETFGGEGYSIICDVNGDVIVGSDNKNFDFNNKNKNFEAMYMESDKNLYIAKRRGKNHYVL